MYVRQCQNKASPGSHLHVREMSKVAWHQNMKKDHLQLTFACEGGGVSVVMLKGGGVGMVSLKSENGTTSGWLWHAMHVREVV